MRNIKNLVVLFFATIAFVSCDDDEVSFALQDVSAPTNLDAIFDIAQDDSGSVSVTPTGIGASTFEIYFGDEENETPTEAAPGETVTNVYAEGEYTLRVVGIGATGLTSELSRIVVISFTPPSDLAFDVVISEANPFEITVNPTAENATVFDILYGDEEDGTAPETIMSSETATHVYDEAGDYVVTVVARGAGVATIELTQNITIIGDTVPSELPELPIDFESSSIEYTWTGFGTANFGPIPVGLVSNPDMSGINTSATVVEISKPEGAQIWAGAGLDLAGGIDFANSSIIRMKVWSPRAGTPILFKIEDSTSEPDGNGNPSIIAEVNINTTVAMQWEELSFDLASFDDFNVSNSYDRVIIFPDFGSNGIGELFYFDDIELGDSTLALPELPVDFESSSLDYTWTGFGAVDFGPIPAAIVSNPDESGINTSANVVEISKPTGAQVWAGASMNLSGAIDFAEGTTVNVKVWSPRAGIPILFKIEDSNSPLDGNNNPSVITEVIVNTTTAMEWEELSFDLTTFSDFNASNSYDRVILFPDFGTGGADEIFYFDDIELTIPRPELPIDFESSSLDYTWTGFGAADFGPIPAAVVSNPDMSGINTSTNVVEISKPTGAQVWAGASMNLSGAIDFSNGTTVTIKVWSPRVGVPILFKIEDSNSPLDGNNNPSVITEVIVNTTVAMEWEELSFDLTTFSDFNASNSYDRVILFPDFGTGGADELFYFDDLTQ